MSAASTRPSRSSLGKNSTMQSQSSSSCQYGLMSCCRFILSVSTNLDSPETVAETPRYQRLSECSDPTLILAAPHYGLRYGFAPATGNFQRLRGRPPLVSPLKSCMGRSFTAVTQVPFRRECLKGPSGLRYTRKNGPRNISVHLA